MPKLARSRFLSTLLLAAGAVLLSLAGSASAADTVAIVPAPSSVTARPGQLQLADGSAVSAAGGDAAAARVSAYFIDLVKRTRGLQLATATRAAKGVTFRRAAVAGAGKEGYRLEVGPDGATVTAPTEAGLFYGAGSLWQLMTADGAKGGPAQLSGVSITDSPRFGWRGLMLDSARHFQSTAYVKRLIDVMALHKLNVLHWHLTDDQAWRLQIRKYPRLTDVAAWRVPAGAAAAADIDPATGKPRLYGGFYSQDEVRDIVAYAAARQITVVPEIEMPGHALAPIVAYPQLASVDGPPAGMSDWGIYPYLYNVDETTFTWLEDVLAEVMELFPSPFIHIGGDEAVKDQWKASAKVQARMRELGVKDEAALQGYFTARIAKYLKAHGRRAIGWDEILEGGLPEGAAVMSWRGVEGAVAAAKTGHDTVLAAWPILYLDNRQSDLPDEPPGRGRLVTLKDVYNFDPLPEGVGPEQAKHVLGLQANAWAEHMRTEDRHAWMVWPREAAVAEIGWSKPEARSWDGFIDRLRPWMTRYAALGVPAADSAFRVQVDTVEDVRTGKAAVLLSNQSGVGEIRYATDGTPATPTSTAYAGPVVLDPPAQVSAVAVDGARPLAATVTRRIDQASLRRRVSQELRTCSNKLPLSLEDDAPLNGPRAVFLIDVMEPCWRWEDADLSGVVAISAGVGQIPFNFQIGADREKIHLAEPRTPEGELQVHLDDCGGELVASIPLKPVANETAVATIRSPIKPIDGRRELCFAFTGKGIDPMWAIDWIQLETAPRAQAAR